MKKIIFENLPSQNMPVSAGNFNQMQSNIEESAVIVSATKPTTSEKVWIQKGKNMVKEWYKGSFYSIDTRTFVEHNQFARTGYIKVQPNVDYIFSHSLGNHNGGICCFDENHNFIEEINSQSITTSFKITNANVKYIVVNMWHETDIANESDVQLEQNIITTSYEAYIEPKIHVKNDNGVFEEFVNVEEIKETNYSTIEQRIGTWIDGKPLYRKTIQRSCSEDWTDIDVTNLNADTIYIDYGKTFATFKVGETPFTNGQFYSNNTDYVRIFISGKNNINVAFASPMAERQVTVTIEYTKTTD